MKDRKLSLSPYSIVNKFNEEGLCLWLTIKLLTNNLLNSSKELTVFGGILLNHTRIGPLRVVGKALYIISSETSWRCIVALKVAMWSHGSHVPSYESDEGILNLEGRGWLLMEVMKGESVRWTKSSTWFVLLIFSLISSIALLIWSISFSKCGTLREIVPLEWFLRLTFYTFLTSWFWACPSTHLSWRRLCWLISQVNSWFWQVRFAMDCICWTEGGWIIGVDWWARLGWLEAFPLSWCLGLVAIDLVQTIQPFVKER